MNAPGLRRMYGPLNLFAWSSVAFHMTESILQDLRFALRSLRKQPAVTAIAIACLALGIGANTAIFSVVRAVLLESLPFREPTRLARLYESMNFQGARGTGSVSVANYLDWRAQN